MIIPTRTSSPTPSNVSCSNCKACCCRLEVMIISDTGVPEEF
ncbi:YkgJ family cysteine cluster protein, partial [Vibrio parahaemolyticus]|nr:YkgJ family cysteine cluster protein [Vibrio parahaemolyticus]